MANIELIKEVVALIEKDEIEFGGKHFDMSGWVVPPEDPGLPAFCNTAMCFAGWADVNRVGGIEKFLRLALKKVSDDFEDWDDEDAEWDTTDYIIDIEERSARYMDLDPWQAKQMFYATEVDDVASLKQRITNVLEEVIWPGIAPGPFRAVSY